MEAKENRFTLCFPSAGSVQPLPGKQLLWKTNVITNALSPCPCLSFFLAFVAVQMSYDMEYPFG